MKLGGFLKILLKEANNIGRHLFCPIHKLKLSVGLE
jgi:hypothetical protein